MARSGLEPHTEAFLATLFGHMTLTFSARELHVVMPDIEISVSGVQKPFAGFEERKPCTVLHCSKSAVVWSAKQFFGTEPGATTFHFVDTDTFWLYAGSTDPKVPDLHVREFFRRVR